MAIYRLFKKSLKFIARTIWQVLVVTVKTVINVSINTPTRINKINTYIDKRLGNRSFFVIVTSDPLIRPLLLEVSKVFRMKFWVKTLLWMHLVVAFAIVIFWLFQGIVSPVFTPEVRRWSPYIYLWSNEYGLDPNVVATIMQIESCGDPYALSRAGAEGLFQVMPFHFERGEIRTNPQTNAKRGLLYFRERLEASNGNLEEAFAQYNGGPRARYPENRVAETQRYVIWAMGIYQDAKEGNVESETLNKWLEAGGASLCRNARKIRGTDSQPLIAAIPRISFARLPIFNTTEACDKRGLPIEGEITQLPSARHLAVDIRATRNTPVPASIEGQVVHAGWNSEGYGNLVIVDNGNVQVYFAHLNSISVEVGTRVKLGEVVGLSGNTGRSTGPHLHYEVRYNWKQIDPLSISAQMLTCR
jgi:murein DD-endopeptidase MepM/ murein hydrolase activator NlpD